MVHSQRIEDLRRRIQQDPSSIAFAQLAEELRRAGEYQESIDACRAGLATHPTYLSARVTLARALAELQQFDEAQAEFRQVLRSAAENLAALRGLAEIHVRRTELVDALAYYRAALGLARNDPELQQRVADLAQRVADQRQQAAAPSAVPGVPREGASTPGPSASVPTPDTNERRAAAPKPPSREELAATGEAAAAAATRDRPAPPPLRNRVAGFAQTTVRHVSEVAVASTPLARPRPAPPPAEPETVRLVHPSEQTTAFARRERAARTIAALEQWLQAVHVVRSQRRA